MTAEELRKAEARYQRAFARAEEARKARNELFARAHAEGWSHGRIAAEVPSLSRARIGKIVKDAAG